MCKLTKSLEEKHMRKTTRQKHTRKEEKQRSTLRLPEPTRTPAPAENVQSRPNGKTHRHQPPQAMRQKSGLLLDYAGWFIHPHYIGLAKDQSIEVLIQGLPGNLRIMAQLPC